MKSKIILCSALAISFTAGLGFNNIAMSNMAGSKIAVIDVAKVVSESKEVNALKKEQAAKMQDLQKWLDTVRADVQKQSTQEGKQKLAQKYDKDFANKKEAIQKDYIAKLTKIDKNISSVIATQAKSKGYDFVIAKNVVLYGGDDLTAEISKLVK